MVNKYKSAKKNNCTIQVYTQDNITMRNNFFESSYGQGSKLVKILNEGDNKGAYIMKNDSKKYVLKVRHQSVNNGFEMIISDIIRNNYNVHVIQSIDFFIKNDYYYYIYEYFDGITLLDYITNNRFISEYQIKNIIKSITRGINFLHSHNIIHCDLKLDNVMINKKGIVKIIDFDLSIVNSDPEGYASDKIFGTMQYIAPESYDLCVYSRKTDIWQMGIILYVLMTGEFPYQTPISTINSYSNLSRFNRFKHINFSKVIEYSKDREFSEDLISLLRNMLAFSDSARYDSWDILNTDWIKN